MTREDLEGTIVFMSLFTNPGISIDVINEKYGLKLSEHTSNEEALDLYIKANKIFFLELDSISVRGELIIELKSKNDWINKIPNRLPEKTRFNEQFLWVDLNGCVFESGKDFSAAEKIKSYPCKVYKTITVSEFEERQVKCE